jgi:hypothetical protein
LYPEGRGEHNALIHKNYLTPTNGSGYIKLGATFLTDSIEGCILYETYKGTHPGNAKDYLGVQEDQDEISNEEQGNKKSKQFEMTNPYSLLKNFAGNMDYGIMYNDSNNVPIYGSLFIDSGVTVEAKIEYKDAFKNRDDIITPSGEKVDLSDILGYPASIPRESEPFYDLVLFFTNNNFLTEQRWNEHPKTECYIKPENFSLLYDIGEGYRSRLREIDRTVDCTRYELTLNARDVPNVLAEIICDDDLKLEMEIGRPISKITLRVSGRENSYYYGFNIGSKIYYISGNAEVPDGVEKRNYLNWERFFTIMGESGTVNSILCNHDLIVRAIMNGSLSFEDLLRVYLLSDFEGKKKRKKLRTLVCEHHLEWNKALYNNDYFRRKRIFGERRLHLNAVMGKLDLWTNPREGETNIAELPKGQVWFAHPVYFINHLDRAGLLDRTFNPYFGKEFPEVRQWSSGGIICEQFIFQGKVYDNPGFAPRWEVHSERFEGDVFDGYAVPTGFFNQEYYNTRTKKTYKHEGVDFRGSRPESEIISFIYGKVINAGWLNKSNNTPSGYGRVLIVANTRGTGIYLLAHLSGFANGVQKGSIIEPHDVVAYPGRSGYGEETTWAPHLHVSYYHVPYFASKDRNGDENEYVVERGDKLVLGSELSDDNWRNPFKHDEKRQ